MSRKYWYSHAAEQQVGLMRCNVCNRQIESGEYRYYETPRSYQPQHRACTEADPVWARMDARRAEAERLFAEEKAACLAFYERWGITDLSDYLPEKSA